MANYYLQKLPEGMKESEEVVYPKMQTYNMHDFEIVLKHMKTYAGNFSEGTMRAVIDALVQTMRSWMPLGHSIKIDGLGVFTLSLGFDTSTSSEKEIANEKVGADKGKTKYRHICIKSIKFKPDSELLADMNREATFDRVETEVKMPRKNKFSREERLEKAMAIIEKSGYMTLSDYSRATGLSRAAASRDLKSLVADQNSGIASRGSHSHKVWVKMEELE